MLLSQRVTVRMGNGRPVLALLGSQPRKPDLSRAVSRAAQPAGQGREFYLSPSFCRPHLECYIQIWDPQHKKDVGLLEKIQRRAKRVGRRAGTR